VARHDLDPAHQPPSAGHQAEFTILIKTVAHPRLLDALLVARQKRIQLDGEDFYIDLLFYNRKLLS
jgi:hypothetical protein